MTATTTRRRLATGFALGALAWLSMPLDFARAQEAVADSATTEDPIARIREEGLERSQVMETLSYLTDVIGPRLTNSPGMKRANDWTRDTLESWGLENAELQAFGPFGRGWELKKFSLQVVEPQCIPLIGYPKAWSPGVETSAEGGEHVGPVVHFQADSPDDLDKYKGKLEGAIVLIGDIRPLAARFEPLASRRTEANLLDLANAPAAGQRGRTRPTSPRPSQRPSEEDVQRARDRATGARLRDQFLIDEGVALIINPSTRGDGGTIFVQSATVPTPPPSDSDEGEGSTATRPRAWSPEAPKILPQVVLAAEHFNRLARMLQQDEELTMAVTLDVAFHDDDLMAYNTIAEIPGTDPDLKEQVVMLGGHLDSWHSSTCATDNAAGVAVGMEAVRILKALELEPRRTIRIALWSGEEQGLLGSRAYVAEHLAERGDRGRIEPKLAHENFSAYYNLDNGTGKIRGVYLQGNEAVRPIFREWLEPFRDLDASTLAATNTGGTDHLSFDGVGLPGFQFIQDAIEYSTRTHHSNMDEYDRAQADDLKQASVIMAAFVYNTAMRDDLLPRKPTSGATSAPEPSTPRGDVGGED
ncbi:hypothetical protein BH23PLA1_BH23PLA1_32630 [soil metagenome]